ncbi:hypothetical protein HZH66_004565 [Vespula vulgaris]|uniref:Uncharacterized protein n=1 Tax=Vespula vulgaris TaxID=7454 RepID=A0A834K935_VESVU|nr:hypothetical protein HZH66_004565 [Vespula vulgaris]
MTKSASTDLSVVLCVTSALQKNVDLLLKMHCPCHGTMVDSTVGGISGPFHDPLTGQTSDACCWKWKQRRSHRSRSMAC